MALLLAALLLLIGLLTQLKPAKRTAVVLRHLPPTTSHFIGLQQNSRIHKSASARRPKRVLVVKPTANDRL
ncbi:hypothetical protein BXP70_11300 [Hymenobacter crusticola]|uniref:Uncharacterized protein n=1 Tax=Hymenobacter crusticola TaxID=1770526 RepID=A0A243WF21_9BACT|nr:hypothetical protein BXP70_11300 [Hymenobacter crusticola]